MLLCSWRRMFTYLEVVLSQLVVQVVDLDLRSAAITAPGVR
jgi:hypothetical protein